MNEVPPTQEPPLNATDRNVKTALGLFSGHITLPASFLTGSLILILSAFLLIIHWQFDQTSQIRARLSRQEEIVQGFLAEKGVVIPPVTPIAKPEFKK